MRDSHFWDDFYIDALDLYRIHTFITWNLDIDIMKKVDEIKIDGLTRYELSNGVGSKMICVHYNPSQGNINPDDAAKEFLVIVSDWVGEGQFSQEGEENGFFEMSLEEVAVLYRQNTIVGVTVIPDENCNCQWNN